METPTKIKIIAVVAALAGPFLTFQGHKDKENLAALEKDGVTVEATIEGGEWRKGKRGSRNYSFDVSYAPQAGAPQKKSFKVTSNFFNAHSTEEAITDPHCQVRYLPANPDNAIVVGGSTDDTWLFPAGLGATILGLLTAIYMFFMYKPAAA